MKLQMTPTQCSRVEIFVNYFLRRLNYGTDDCPISGQCSILNTFRKSYLMFSERIKTKHWSKMCSEIIHLKSDSPEVWSKQNYQCKIFSHLFNPIQNGAGQKVPPPDFFL